MEINNKEELLKAIEDLQSRLAMVEDGLSKGDDEPTEEPTEDEPTDGGTEEGAEVESEDEIEKLLEG